MYKSKAIVGCVAKIMGFALTKKKLLILFTGLVYSSLQICLLFGHFGNALFRSQILLYLNSFIFEIECASVGLVLLTSASIDPYLTFIS